MRIKKGGYRLPPHHPPTRQMRDDEGSMAECHPKNTYIATARTWIYFNMFSGKL